MAMKMVAMMMLVSLIITMTMMTQKILTMGMALFTTSILIAMMTSTITNSWYGFILSLIFITGLLVLFGYFLALTPNTFQSMKKSIKLMGIILVPSMTFSSVKLLNMPSYKLSFEKEVSSIISKSNMMIYILLTIILLLALLMVVSLTFKSPTPLRKYM